MKAWIFSVLFVSTVAACGVFGTPKAGPCGICEPITIYGQMFDVCGKPAELARLRALAARKQKESFE